MRTVLLEKRTDRCGFAVRKIQNRNGSMIKCLLTGLGPAGREDIWLSLRKHGP